MDSKQTLDGHQLSQKMNLIVPHQLRQQFYNFIKRYNTIYQIFCDTLLPQSKTNNFPWQPIKSLFQVNKYKKQLLIFGSEFFSKSPQNKHSINSPSPWHKFYCILLISTTSCKCPSKIFSYSLKAYSNNFIPLQEFGLREVPFPLNIGINELNIHSSSNLFLNKILLNIFVKDFKHLSLPALNISIVTPEGPLAFLIFIQFIAHCTSSTSILLTAPSTLIALMLLLHSFSTFINFFICFFQIFFRSSTLTFTAPLSSLRQLTPTTFFVWQF